MNATWQMNFNQWFICIFIVTYDIYQKNLVQCLITSKDIVRDFVYMWFTFEIVTIYILSLKSHLFVFKMYIYSDLKLILNAIISGVINNHNFYFRFKQKKWLRFLLTEGWLEIKLMRRWHLFYLIYLFSFRLLHWKVLFYYFHINYMFIYWLILIFIYKELRLQRQ